MSRASNGIKYAANPKYNPPRPASPTPKPAPVDLDRDPQPESAPHESKRKYLPLAADPNQIFLSATDPSPRTAYTIGNREDPCSVSFVSAGKFSALKVKPNKTDDIIFRQADDKLVPETVGVYKRIVDETYKNIGIKINKSEVVVIDATQSPPVPMKFEDLEKKDGVVLLVTSNFFDNFTPKGKDTSVAGVSIRAHTIWRVRRGPAADDKAAAAAAASKKRKTFSMTVDEALSIDF